MLQLCQCPETASDGKIWGGTFPWKRKFLSCLEGHTGLGANNVETPVFQKGSWNSAFQSLRLTQGLGETSLRLSLACVLFGLTFCVENQDVISLNWFGVCPGFEVSELCVGVCGA